MYILVGIAFLVIGLVMVVSPSTVFQITESWKNDKASEPSKLFRISTINSIIGATINPNRRGKRYA